MERNIEKLGKMNIRRLVITMSLPAMVSMMVQALYNIVDSMFVANVNEQALTAVSLAFPIQIIIIAISVGIGVGLNSVISRKLGAKDMNSAVNAAEHGFFIAIILWLILLFLSLILPRFFFAFFTDDPIITEYAIKYITIIMIFSIFNIIGQVCISILQATGNMVSSMKIQLIGAITNIILDPLLIFGVWIFPELGVVGAAIATVIGRCFAMLYALILVLKRNTGLKLNLKKFHFDFVITRKIFAVGLPVMVMQGLGSVMIGGLNFILSTFGPTPIAVFGAYFKVQSFAFMPVFGICQGTMPIVGYNFGAKNKKRVMDAVKNAIGLSLAIMVSCMILIQIFPHVILSWFNSSPEMMAIGIPAFRIISTSYVTAAICVVIGSMFQALGNAHISLFVSFMRQIVTILTAGYVLGKLFGVQGVWWAFPVSELVAVILIAIFAVRFYNNKIKYLESV